MLIAYLEQAAERKNAKDRRLQPKQKDQLRRPKVLTISCSLSSIESRSVVLLLYWRGRWQGIGLAQGLDRGLSREDC